MRQSCSRQGMTLIEVLLTVAVVAMLAAFLIPAVNMAIRSRENAQAASKLRTAVTAFTMYRSEMGSYPADKNPGQIPPEMTEYFVELNIDDWWSDATELGGGWDWDELKYSANWGGHSPIISVSISEPSKTGQMADFDKLVDDGNLNTGKFRQIGTQYHYIIEK